MASWSETELSSVESNHGRFDAEYYKPEFLKTEKILFKIDGIKLRNACSKIDVGHVGPMVYNYSDKGVLLLQTQNVREFFLDLEHSIKIKTEFHEKLSKSQVKKGDILIARSGSFGSAAIYLEDRTINSADIIIVRLNEPKINRLFAVAFMNTKYGSNQLIRFASGGVQGHVNLRILENFHLPYFEEKIQKNIALLVQNAYDKLQESDQFHEQIQQLFEAELGLDKSDFKKPIGYTAIFSEIEQSRRLDPEHFYPQFSYLVQSLSPKVNFVPFSNQLTFCQRGKQPVYSYNGLPVINSKHVQPNKVVLKGNRKAIPNPNPDLQIRHGDVLINGTGRGTLGRAAPYLIEDPAIPDNHVTILRSPTLDPAYLSFYLNSQAGQLQVEMHQRGTSGQLELYPFDIRKFLVWVAPDEIQREIRRLYDQAAESKRQSQELLENAKKRVEQLIEEAAAGE